MASSRYNTANDYGNAAATDSSVAFALEEMIACWTQAHEVMTRGDLQSVASLLDQADRQLQAAGSGQSDSPDEARLRQRAVTAFGLLQHAMQSGLDGMRKELGQARRGAKALRGYVHAAGNAQGNLLNRS